MLPAIKLQHQPVLDGREIRNEWSDWHLPAKFDACQPAVAQQAPHFSLGICQVAAECACGVSFLAISHALLALTRLLRSLPLRKREREGDFNFDWR